MILKKKKIILMFLFLFIFISIGFAVLTSNLNITGIFNFTPNTFDISIENIKVDDASVNKKIPIINEDNNEITFDVALSTPLDKYIFYFDIKNNSTLDAMLENFELSGLSDEQKQLINFKATYLNGNTPNKKDLLLKNYASSFKVEISYADLTSEQLPTQTENLKLKINIKYVQAKDANLVADTNLVNYDAKNEERQFTATHSGTYKLEVWGSQGVLNYAGKLGYGGYAVGEVDLNKGEKLYISVGSIDGIWNGGASRGGDASHISTTSGLLPTFQNNTENLLIVAGGAGGCENCEISGSGGGFEGTDGIPSETHPFLGTGGTQSEGGKGMYTTINPAYANVNGSFGTAGDGRAVKDKDNGPAGGAGYYGGGATTYAGAGGGGSGYIGNPKLKNKSMYCYKCKTSDNESTKTFTTENTEAYPTSKFAKIGNGYARITLVSIK